MAKQFGVLGWLLVAGQVQHGLSLRGIKLCRGRRAMGGGGSGDFVHGLCVGRARWGHRGQGPTPADPELIERAATYTRWMIEGGYALRDSIEQKAEARRHLLALYCLLLLLDCDSLAVILFLPSL